MVKFGRKFFFDNKHSKKSYFCLKVSSFCDIIKHAVIYLLCNLFSGGESGCPNHYANNIL